MDLIGNTFTLLKSVDSTNNYAMARVHAGLAKHGEAYFSYEQTAGKGQRGKAWNSGTAENIILSCILQPDCLSLTNQFMLSITVALSCYDFVNDLTRGETAIKWPNDIYWRDRKAGGILIENNIKGSHWEYAVAGIGLNMNQTNFPPDLPNPVSIKQVTGKSYDIVKSAKSLCVYLQNRWESLNSRGESDVLEEYNSILYKRGQTVVLKSGNVSFEAVVKGVDEEGRLMTTGTKEETFNWGKVEWVR